MALLTLVSLLDGIQDGLNGLSIQRLRFLRFGGIGVLVLGGFACPRLRLLVAFLLLVRRSAALVLLLLLFLRLLLPLLAFLLLVLLIFLILPLLLALLLLLALASLLVSLVSGSVSIGWQELLAVLSGADDGLAAQVILELRWPRAVAAFTTGALLSLAGALMQGSGGKRRRRTAPPAAPASRLIRCR